MVKRAHCCLRGGGRITRKFPSYSCFQFTGLSKTDLETRLDSFIAALESAGYVLEGPMMGQIGGDLGPGKWVFAQREE